MQAHPSFQDSSDRIHHGSRGVDSVRWKEMYSSVDAHVAGQPLRLITFGVPKLQPGTIREQAAEFQDKHDNIRMSLLTEPRGYAGMTGALLVQSPNPDADYGVIFMTGGGYSPISGHGMIALATTLIETGTVPFDGPDTRITFDTGVGLIKARASVDGNRVRGVRFRNVPSFRLAHDIPIDVNGKSVPVDVAFGGNWYAVVRAEDLGVSLHSRHAAQLAALGTQVLKGTSNEIDVVHPEDHLLAGIYGTVILGEPHSEDATSRNVTIYHGGQIDRSPCGTGMAATMACMAADDQLKVGDTFFSESIINTMLSGRIVVGTSVGKYPAIITEISGRGEVTGTHQFFVDPTEQSSSGLFAL